jgi:hypothetical protein
LGRKWFHDHRNDNLTADVMPPYFLLSQEYKCLVLHLEVENIDLED